MKTNSKNAYRKNGGRGAVTKGNLIFCLVASLIIGSVFTFGMNYWNRVVTEEEAIPAAGTFESCKIVRSETRGRTVKEIALRFSDLEQKFLDGATVTQTLRSQIENLTPGTKCELLIHPNSSTVLQLKANGVTLLPFDTANAALGTETKRFTVLGIGLYGLSAFFAFMLYTKRYE